MLRQLIIGYAFILLYHYIKNHKSLKYTKQNIMTLGMYYVFVYGLEEVIFVQNNTQLSYIYL